MFIKIKLRRAAKKNNKVYSRHNSQPSRNCRQKKEKTNQIQKTIGFIRQTINIRFFETGVA